MTADKIMYLLYLINHQDMQVSGKQQMDAYNTPGTSIEKIQCKNNILWPVLIDFC